MGHLNTRTCLSTEKHDDRVLDVTLHYFGCLKVSDRQEYFEALPEKSKKRIVEEKSRVRHHRSYFESYPDTEAGSALKNFKATLSEWRRLNHKRDPEIVRSASLDKRIDVNVEKEIKASVIYFKDSRPYNVPNVGNSFPNQKISVAELLAENEVSNPLMQPCEDGMIRYFHLPANNMLWVEETMARYYSEVRTPRDESLWYSKGVGKSNSEMLLSSEYWAGQQEGSRGHEVHARGMRPLCEVMSIDPASMEGVSKNMVLFMPYLHWETDKARSRSARIIKEASAVGLSTLEEVVDQMRENEQNARNAHVVSTAAVLALKEDTHPPPTPIYNTAKAPLSVRREVLGRLLRWAAMFAEDMNSIVDEKLHMKYLHAESPLHPRRTLDQSYYKTLRNTKQRDQDQVVFRATTTRCHECFKTSPVDLCTGCNQDIKNIPRIIMVDQLWMWILDEKTVITSFPKRWGRNRADPSAVHKNIRMRLRDARPGEIRSVYDLSLIIVDQCSRVFFDRSRPLGIQPNLVDIFADAIRGVTYMQTAAFAQFLTYTHIASADYNSGEKSRSSSTYQNTLLNINPEGNLLKEVKDILDELHILTRIQIQQQNVAEIFVRNIRHILRPKVEQLASSSYREGSPSTLNQIDLPQIEESEAAKRTLDKADSLLEAVQSRISELNTLQEYARNTSAALKDLLTLKQQQSGIFEAREAVKQATETLKQGRSIVLFTVVTIIFLPLSFCASIFGMNTREFNGGSMSLREEFTYMFPISIAIISTSFILAFSRNAFMSSFSTIVWATLAYPAHVAGTWFLTTTGLYAFSRDLYNRAHALSERDKKTTNMMKVEALRRRMEEDGGMMREKIKSLRIKGKGGKEGHEMGESADGSENRGERRRGTLSEVESGEGSRNTSEMRLYHSPRL